MLSSFLAMSLCAQGVAQEQSKSDAAKGKTAVELLKNPRFLQDLSGWKVEENGATGKVVVSKEGPRRNPSLKLEVLSVGDQPWRLQVHQGGLKVTKGTSYVFTFWAKASQETLITVNCMQNHAPWEHHGAATEMRIGTSWKQYTFPFVGPWDDTNARMTFTNLGTVKGTTYWFADTSLRVTKGGK
ncbi:MAG: carbohydrate binding domain-containing protein [Fimbriimonas sp.]